MSNFMRPEITEKMRGWAVDTTDAGVCYVPEDVVPVPDWLKTGAVLAPEDGGSETRPVLAGLTMRLADYIEGRRWISIEVCEGYFARLSAPGYLDCTEWSCYRTLHEAREALRDDLCP